MIIHFENQQLIKMNEEINNSKQLKKEMGYLGSGLFDKNNKQIFIVKNIDLVRSIDNQSEKYRAFFNAFDIIRWLKYCQIYNEIPLIFHTHIMKNGLKFSSCDEDFEVKILNVQKELYCSKELISVLGTTEGIIARTYNRNGKFKELGKIL